MSAYEIEAEFKALQLAQRPLPAFRFRGEPKMPHPGTHLQRLCPTEDWLCTRSYRASRVAAMMTSRESR